MLSVSMDPLALGAEPPPSTFCRAATWSGCRLSGNLTWNWMYRLPRS